MSSRKSNILLLICAAIWGFAFTAQRLGMEYIGPFTYNGVRFALGSISLLPFIFYFDMKKKRRGHTITSWKYEARQGLIVGIVLFIAASLQQVGLIYTEAGKAAFITGMYVVMVPLVGILILKHRVSRNTLLGSATAAVGLYLLSVKSGFNISIGDLYEIAGAVFWTVHILMLDIFVKKMDTLKLALFQFITCSVLSLIIAFLFETITLHGIQLTLIPIVYGGVFSVGLAYTLQIIGQKHAQPAHAAIILSLETVFGALGGFLIINEFLGGKEYIGCMLMLAGMLISQFNNSPKPDIVEGTEA
ncbi:MAG: EamA family transporter [Ignavibacteriae bacterium HGW-Ignavibacteriae-4]|nr:MAG: EamA family transporter [Ignavibacteriae bacterium HGW-Ignavibacteriae-4]